MEENKKCYSDAELEEFRVLIEDKIAKATKEYEELCSTLGDDSEDSQETMHSRNVFDEGSSTAQRSQTQQLAQRQKQFIEKLQAALVRIDNKTYGVCRVTGELIPKDRLRAVPHATLSIEAKNK